MNSSLFSRHATIRADLLRKDLDLLEPVMMRAYGGWETAKQRGFDWARWFADWRTALGHRGTARLSLDEAFAPIDRLLDVQLDNHTQIPIARMTLAGSQTALLREAPTGDCSEIETDGGRRALDRDDRAQRVRARPIASPRGGLVPGFSFSYPVRSGALRSIHCGDRRIPLDVVAPGYAANLRGLVHVLESELGHDPPTVRRLAEDVVYVRLPSFLPDRYADVEKDRPRWPTASSADRALVVDLRGNEGGSYDLALPILRDWIDVQRLPSVDTYPATVAHSCLYAPLKWGFERAFFDPSPALPDDQRRDLQGALDALFVTAPVDCPRVEVQHSGIAYRDHRFERHPGGRRLVLVVDNACGSDCEGFLELASTLPEAVLVGVNTLGLGQFTQPGTSLLPHTGLRYRIALGHSDIYGDGRSFDGYGLDVDVVLPHPERWHDAELLGLVRTLDAAP